MLRLIQASLNYLERCEGSAPPHLNWNVEYATITPIPLIKNKDENTPYCEPTLERLFVSFRFHFLLRSISSMWVGNANHS